MTDKVDLKRTLDPFRARVGELRLLDVPDLSYLALDGHSDPAGEAFAEALAALYPVAYALKLASKGRGRDYVVPPLEGLWWAEDMEAFTSRRDKSRWSWTLLLMVPDWLGASDVDQAVARVAQRARPSRLDDLEHRTLSEGRCVQTLHVGSFDDEADVLAQLHHEFVPRHGLRLTGRHHEVYLSDVRRTPPARRRTILRQPVRQARPDERGRSSGTRDRHELT